MLLTSCLSSAKLEQKQYDAAEFFAGAGQVSHAFRMSNQACAAVDYDYDSVVGKKGAMNILTDSGLVHLVLA